MITKHASHAQNKVRVTFVLPRDPNAENICVCGD